MSLARTTPLKRSAGPARKTPLRPSTWRRAVTKTAKPPAWGPRPRRRPGRHKGLELLKKTEAKFRDHFRCQFPGCDVQGREFTEAAHLVDSGMGGRPSVSSNRGDFVTTCNHLAPDGGHHRGRRSIHTTHIEVRPRDPELGADGALDWYTRTRRGNEWSPWKHVGTTRAAAIDIVRS